MRRVQVRKVVETGCAHCACWSCHGIEGLSEAGGATASCLLINRIAIFNYLQSRAARMAAIVDIGGRERDGGREEDLPNIAFPPENSDPTEKL